MASDKRKTIFPGGEASGRYPVTRSLEAIDLVPVYSGHPWKNYTRQWAIGSKQSITVVYDKKCPTELFTIRSKTAGSEQQLCAARQLKHKNLVPINEIFAAEANLYIISPYYDISLEAINSSPRYPDDMQLAIIAREILDGIRFLETHCWTHGHIRCASILLNRDGEVRISQFCTLGLVEADAYKQISRIVIRATLGTSSAQIRKLSGEYLQPPWTKAWNNARHSEFKFRTGGRNLRLILCQRPNSLPLNSYSNTHLFKPTPAQHP